MRTTIVQQDLQFQDSSNVAAREDTEALAAREGADTEMAAQDSSDAWSSSHPINVRLTIPVPFSRYYLSIVGGKERRGPSRLKKERSKHPLATTGNIILLGVLGLITGLAVFAVIQLVARTVLEQAGVV